MNINLTLLAQLGNFILAYKLIEKIAFKDIVQLMEHDRQELDHFTKEHQQAQQELLEAEARKQKDWQRVQEQFAALLPSPSPLQDPPRSEMHPLEPLSSEQLHQTIASITDFLTAKVSRV